MFFTTSILRTTKSTANTTFILAASLVLSFLFNFFIACLATDYPYVWFFAEKYTLVQSVFTIKWNVDKNNSVWKQDD